MGHFLRFFDTDFPSVCPSAWALLQAFQPNHKFPIPAHGIFATLRIFHAGMGSAPRLCDYPRFYFMTEVDADLCDRSLRAWAMTGWRKHPHGHAAAEQQARCNE